jgi:hypothetical protein
MKILLTRALYPGYVSGPPDPAIPNGSQQDYLPDCIFHGLRTLIGADIVDAPRLWYMYKDSFGPGKQDLTSLYGRGFTSFGMLDDIEVDRDDIENKIINQYFDVIMVGSMDDGTPYFDLIFKHYPANKIIILDGNDSFRILHDYLNKGVYFKRELLDPTLPTIPISFAIPKEKLQPPLLKTKLLAHVDPRDRNTYIHYSEKSYYEDYGTAMFGITMKKGGWDCMRHYEILGCRTLPLFLDIEQCPEHICKTLPKDKLVLILQTAREKTIEWFATPPGISFYQDIEYQVHNHFVNNCTTEVLGKYVLDSYAKRTGITLV